MILLFEYIKNKNKNLTVLTIKLFFAEGFQLQTWIEVIPFNEILAMLISLTNYYLLIIMNLWGQISLTNFQ